jgi:NAD(P)H-dependent FMN reductase
VLKNALDLMGFEQFQGKRVGLVGVSGGRMGALNAPNSLRTISRALHAWVVPEQVATPQAWNEFAEDGSIADDELGARIRGVGAQVARFSYLHNSQQALEFLRRWESAPENPGGGLEDS